LNNSLLEARSSVDALGLRFGAKGIAPLGSPVQTHILDGKLEALSPQAPYARELYEWLGFHYSAIDIDGSPGSIPLDLNYDDVPAQELGKYQLVTNFGTTEHAANQLNAFKIIHELTSLGGIMVHAVPAQGFFNHDLVNNNPRFFWLLARSKNCAVVCENGDVLVKQWKASEAGCELTVESAEAWILVAPGPCHLNHAPLMRTASGLEAKHLSGGVLDAGAKDIGCRSTRFIGGVLRLAPLDDAGLERHPPALSPLGAGPVLDHAQHGPVRKPLGRDLQSYL
jgi:hypothetical protein